jgi:hypothetical protein
MSSPELEQTAAEELEHALDLGWKALAPHVPWGDTYTGVSVAGREVEIARSYIWAEAEGGDILCEVVVYAGETRYDHGARVSRVIKKP